MSLKFCILIESNSPNNIFAIVLYIKIARVTFRENRELAKYLPQPIFLSFFFEAIFPELVTYLLKSKQNRIFLNFIANEFSSETKQ